VHDTFLTPLAQGADVVLPRVTFAGKDGTYTNLERRVQRVKPAVGPEGQAQPEGWLIAELARRMGANGFQFGSVSETMDEISRAVPVYGGISHRRLEREGGLVLRTTLESPQPTQVLYAGKQDRGLQWPCYDDSHPGTPTLYDGGFRDRRADLIVPAFSGGLPEPDPDFPLWFAPGRVLLQQDRQMEVVKGKRNRIRREEWIELNPEDGAEWGIEEGAKVLVEMEDGRVPGVARFESSLPRGVAASTGLFGQLAIEMEASEEFDPASLLPGLDTKRARIVRSQE
jgi:predicted molibdopterin-dependent oxidoreductase YjgC